jgi:Ser/Thr protein kinase RdoA (MazF antagonist)
LGWESNSLVKLGRFTASPNFSPVTVPEQRLQTIADQFAHQGNITGLMAFGSGNINDTFLVALDDALQTRFVLQRINTHVFRDPEAVMQNMRTFTDHMHGRLGGGPGDRRWEVPRVIPTKDGADHWEVDGEFWRAISFVENSESFDLMRDENHAWEVGFALGQFHGLISDLAADRLVDTLPGFHITPGYLVHYEAVLPMTQVEKTEDVAYCLAFVADRAPWCNVLETAKAEGKLPLRLMHGDPKVNNIMFDKTTGKAVAVVDLDTVKPGLVHYDIGDCLRSGCNLLGEETADWRSVTFDLTLCKAILSGYLSVARSFLTSADYDFLFDGIRLIAFELGLRFFTDHLAGDVYFKTKYPGHNLARALVQFQLTASIETQETEICSLINQMRGV